MRIIIFLILLITSIGYSQTSDPCKPAQPQPTPPKLTSKLLFKTNFGKGVIVNPPSYFYPTGNGAWQTITGTDQTTGFTWPPKIFNIDFAGLQLITEYQVTPSTISNHISNSIVTIPGPTGALTSVLFQDLKNKGKAGTDCCAQIPFMLKRPWTYGDIPELYISYWFYHQPDLTSKLSTSIGDGHWRVQFEFKTGGTNNQYGGDYRIITNIIKDTSGKLYWTTRGDNIANGPFAPTTFWRVENRTVPVPLGKWFKYEVYWKRSSGNDGRFWSAVDGNVIVDRMGPNIGVNKNPITRVMINNAYSGGFGPVQSKTTGLEIWSTFPWK